MYLESTAAHEVYHIEQGRFHFVFSHIYIVYIGMCTQYSLWLSLACILGYYRYIGRHGRTFKSEPKGIQGQLLHIPSSLSRPYHSQCRLFFSPHCSTHTYRRGEKKFQCTISLIEIQINKPSLIKLMYLDNNSKIISPSLSPQFNQETNA